ncbi:uncharacterized protein EDB91DRAFT_1245459 [Suillus paluster]|uniref:uncharacterized protein n=1 Tax=Suillus paluster TaxID=48578 RepID=UPI001B8747DB|nr:uncharacterized protein EDB91DRAFT_1245459 [Suillus paluster]KAG1748014.1 hypothetical protein EDB91DRAFT_1245459 [Suillus paluster]
MGGRWTISEKTARSSNISAEAFIGVIVAMDTGLQSDLSQWMESIRSVASEIQFSGATVTSLTYWCKVWGGKGVGWSLISMVNYIQLAMKCQSMIDSSTNYSDLYNTLPVDRPTLYTFLFWIATRFKFMHLAAGGSFYFNSSGRQRPAMDCNWNASQRALGNRQDVEKAEFLRKRFTASHRKENYTDDISSA